MGSRLVHPQYVDAYLMLVIEAIRRNENRIGNVIIVLFDYDSLNSVLIGILVTGKMLFFLTKPISKFLIEKNRSFVRRLPLESDAPFNFKPRVQGGGGSISVWGAMTAKGVGPLVFYDGRLNGQNYINLIEPELLPYIKKNFDRSDSYYFVQDNAPCHKSVFSMNWFNKNKINVLDWPAVSPDFNVIENLWDILVKKLVNHRLNNVYDLQQAILKLWSEISTETCENLVRSMPRRIKKCVRVKGNTSSKY